MRRPQTEMRGIFFPLAPIRFGAGSAPVDVPTVDPNQINDDVHQTGPLETLNDVIASLAAQNYGGFNS